jgi:hypothetical protein
VELPQLSAVGRPVPCRPLAVCCALPTNPPAHSPAASRAIFQLRCVHRTLWYAQSSPIWPSRAPWGVSEWQVFSTWHSGRPSRDRSSMLHAAPQRTPGCSPPRRRRRSALVVCIDQEGVFARQFRHSSLLCRSHCLMVSPAPPPPAHTPITVYTAGHAFAILYLA